MEVHIYMKRTKKFNEKYSADFKLCVILDMRGNHLGYNETVRKYNLGNDQTGGARAMVKRWERIYLEEGELGLMKERRGRTPKGGRSKKPLEPSIEEDLIAENQRLKEQNERLQMEIDYLKKLDALVRRDEQLYGKRMKP